jgi:hypothetical protein
MAASERKKKTRRRAACQAPGIFVIRFDFPAFLKRITGIAGWKEMNGPDSRVGLDYWYRAGRHEANINVDQGHMTVSVDKEVVYEGSADQACRMPRALAMTAQAQRQHTPHGLSVR